MTNFEDALVVPTAEEKLYVKPAITHELKLETRAGSTVPPGIIDPLGIDPTQPRD
jgi:hypothetical protein